MILHDTKDQTSFTLHSEEGSVTFTVISPTQVRLEETNEDGDELTVRYEKKDYARLIYKQLLDQGWEKTMTTDECEDMAALAERGDA
jgi:hypothetical protein